MARTESDTRYTAKQAIRLLARVAAIARPYRVQVIDDLGRAVAHGSGGTYQAYDGPDRISARELKQARRVLQDLLSARLSDVVVDNPTAVLANQSDEDLPAHLLAIFNTLEGALNENHAWPEFTWTVRLLTRGPQSMRLSIDGTPSRVVAWQLYSLLRMTGDRLRQCECGRLFVKVKDKKNCTPRCRKKYYMRDFRAGDAGRQE
jgi:hypothetical protein